MNTTTDGTKLQTDKSSNVPRQGPLSKPSPKLKMPSDPLLKPRVTLKQLAKSRSNEFNVVIAPAILLILDTFGITVPLGVILGSYAVINFILRSVTKTAISDK